VFLNLYKIFTNTTKGNIKPKIISIEYAEEEYNKFHDYVPTNINDLEGKEFKSELFYNFNNTAHKPLEGLKNVFEGGKNKKVKVYLNTKTKHRCKDGILRILYKKGEFYYIKIKNKITKKFKFSRIL